MTDIFMRSVETSPGAKTGAQANASLNATGANVIQKNWQELIRPNKLQVAVGADAKRVATLVAEPLERGFGVTDRKSTRLNSSHIQKSRMPSSA